jgi:hypothetical protein
MKNKTITHEVKLQKSVIVILGVMAFGLCANAFAPTLSVKSALADWSGSPKLEIDLKCRGCR